MLPRDQGNPVTSQVTLIVFALAAFSLAMVVGFGVFAALEIDRKALEKQKAFVAEGISDETAALVRQQTSVTLWDDSVVAARVRDQAWMSENLGEWLYNYYGQDRVYVLDYSGQPVHAMQNGSTLAVSSYVADRDAIEPAVAKLRARLSGIEDDDRRTVFVSDLITIEGAPAIVSVQPILPNSNRVMLKAGEEYVHVAIQAVDGNLVGNIARKYQLADMRILPQETSAPPEASVPLAGAGGRVLGYLSWGQDRPGMELMTEAGPAFLGFCLLAGGFLWFLTRRLRRAAWQLLDSQNQARYLALHDTLTGLPNRALFEDRLENALVAVSGDARKVGLLYVDLDHFKTVNDTFGHPVGDELVRQTASRLKASLRPVDTVARLGGDEFAIIVFDIDGLEGAREICTRLLAAIARPFNLLGNQVFVNASIGVAISGAAETRPADLLRQADIALYEAKKLGGGRHEVFVGNMDDLLVRKRMIEADLRGAISSGEGIRLVYQPIYDAVSGKMVGAEALVRWTHPVQGEVPPAHFLSIADERGMTALLGNWVIAEVARFAARSSLPWIAFNVSPLQLRDTGFAEHVIEAFSAVDVDPRRIQIEIVENALLENSPTTREALSKLRSTGFRIALDDFGTGYSSINYLQRHAIDKLKIDRSFVSMLASEQGDAIVKAIIELAGGLGVKVTAEGVETARQRDRLVELGCDELQGFFLSRPVEADQLEASACACTESAVQHAGIRN